MNGGFDLLTESERACLRLALSRESSKDIAASVGLTHHTVDKRFKSAIRKLGARSRFEAARMFAGYEAPRAANRAWDQSPDGPDQSPDVAADVFSPLIGASIGQPVGRHGERHAGGFREEQVAFLSAWEPQQSYPRWPVRHPGGGGNDLGVWQRIGWTLALTLLFALAFGILSTGLLSLGNMARTVSVNASRR